MASVIITGHGGYATAVKNNLLMLTGRTEGMQFVDFDQGDDLDTLIARLKEAVANCGEGADILFCCDLTGGSPFRQSALLCAEHPGWLTVAGVNSSAYAEMAFNTDKGAEELGELMLSVTRMTAMRFPPKAE